MNIWCNDTNRVKQKCLDKHMSLCYAVDKNSKILDWTHHKSYIEYPGTETDPSLWEVGD
jgi:hypothetical protein